MMETAPKLLVVLLNYRTAELSAQAADAAVQAIASLPAEMVIVDNDSGDGSFDALRDHVAKRGWPHARVLQSGANGGYGAGNNFGIKAGLTDGSQPEYYFLLNSDAFPAENALSELYETLRAKPEVGIAGSFVHGADGAPHVTAFRFPSVLGELEAAAKTGVLTRLLRRWRVPLDDIPSETSRVDWLAGASVMIRRRMLDQIGPFDERFFLYFEETDLCLRAARAGWDTCYVPSSRVCHIGSVSTGMKTWERVPAFWFDSRWHYFCKNHGKAYAVAATIAHLFGGLILRLKQTLRREEIKPKHFLTDLSHHMLRQFWAPSQSSPPGGLAKFRKDT